ncbi:ABC transporter permease [Actinomadura sp. 9N407]|uniref:ABC transporter permease n=1 Tax=Actinomadura sp. 9N407 TaxID=3375154 RepID=UPI00379F966C
MIGLALRTLRFHKGGFIASFIALFFGALIVVGCGGLLETGLRNDAPPQRLAAAPIVVTGDQRYLGTASEMVFPERVHLDAALTAELASIPGVTATLPDVSFPATLARTEVTGHGWSSARLAPYRLSEGTAPAGPGQIVLGTRLAEQAGLRPGARIELLAGGTTGTYEITGLADGAGNDVFLSDAQAGQVTGRPGKIDSIGVLTTTDTARIAATIRKAVAGKPIAVLTGDDRGQAENPGILADGSDLIPLAAAFGGLSMLVTVFAVAGTLGLSIQQRQREMALLRAIGTTPGQLRRLILGETMVLAAIATALACYPGPRFGRWLLDSFAGAGVVPEAIAFRSGPFPLIVGVGTALLTAIGAAFIVSNGAARTRPTEALADTSVRRRFSIVRLITGLLCLAGGTALAIGTAGSDGPDAGGVATPAALVWTVGFGLLAPLPIRAFTTMLRPTSGLAGHLATRNVQARTTRLVAAMMPVMLATGLAIGLIYMQTTQSEGAKKAFEESLRADLVVTSATGGMPLTMVDTIKKHPGVAAATAQITSLGYIEPDAPAEPLDEESEAAQPTEMSLRGITPEGSAQTTAFRATTGSLDALHGATVALPSRYAGKYEIGDTVPMRLGDGGRTGLKLVATLDGDRGYETALVPAATLIGHTDSGLVPQIMVTATPGTDRAGLAKTLAAQHPGLRTTAHATLTGGQDNTQGWMAYLVLSVVVGYALISLVNTQILATSERRREFMLLRLVGATRRQVLHMMTIEAVLIALAGIALGTMVAALTLAPLSLSVLGTVIPSGSPWILATVIAAALALTLTTTLLAAQAVLRTHPGDMAGQPE